MHKEALRRTKTPYEALSRNKTHTYSQRRTEMHYEAQRRTNTPYDELSRTKTH